MEQRGLSPRALENLETGGEDGSVESVWGGKGRLLGRQHNTPLTFSNERTIRSGKVNSGPFAASQRAVLIPGKVTPLAIGINKRGQNEPLPRLSSKEAGRLAHVFLFISPFYDIIIVHRVF